jgi:hypothetical protein
LRNRFKIAPTVALTNVDPRPFWIRSYLTGGTLVHQSKRLTYGISASPTVFGLWPGFGPFRRLRHSVSPTLSYTMAPRASIPRAYLAAVGETHQRYLGTLPQSAISLGLSQNLEAKLRAPDDTSGADARKLKLLSMQFSSLSYDFERARAAGRRLAGLTTESFSTRATSDLLPGMDFALDYSLFRGSTLTDTAEFTPFLTRVATSVRFSNRENPLTVIAGLLRREERVAPAGDTTAAADPTGFRQYGSQQVAGQGARGSAFYVPPVDGWQANLSFSLARSRPPRAGAQVINFDPRVRCEPFRNIPFAFDECLRAPTDAPPPSPFGGAPVLVGPPQISTSADLRFRLTEHWSATWNTSFDFVRHEFASQVVTLQRDLHDWRAVFGFTRSSNGNFAFTFNIALKPQPDLKFDYSRASVRSR